VLAFSFSISKQVSWLMRRRRRKSSVDVVYQLPIPLPQFLIGLLHLLRQLAFLKPVAGYAGN
jgi:ABC-type sulfate transport system permease component